MAIQIAAPFDMFNGLDGKPLSNGKVYIGQIGTDPTVVGNQIPVFWDEGLTIPAAQPLVTNAGYIVRFGTPARVYAATDYSISVRNTSNVLVYYLAQFGAVDYASSTDLSALSGALQLADYGALRAYTGARNAVYVAGSGIAGEFVRVSSGSDNGGTIIVASNGIIWSRVYSGPVDVRWWGAKFDNVANDTAAIQACVDYAQPLQKQIILPDGTAKITASIQVAFSLLGLNMQGQGFQRTRIDYSGIIPTVNPAIFITGHSGQGCGAVIEGIRFDGNATSSGILIAGQDLQTIRNCQFGLNANGIVFRNAVAGSFTEYCVADACDFLPECASAIWYSIQGTGDMSFHGSGLRNCTIASPSTPGYRCIVVDPKALPYNAPLSAQFWGNGVGDIISMPGYSGSNIPIFVGNLTVEAFVPGLVGCKAPIGYEVPLVGKLSCASPNFSMGSLFLADAAIGSSGGTLQTIGGRVEHYQNLVPGANAMGRIPPSIAKGAVEYLVHILGPLYDYRYKVGTFTTLSGGTAQILATYSQYNQAGYGAPTFSIDPTVFSLVITNAAYPPTGVSVTVSAIQVGQSVYDPFFF